MMTTVPMELFCALVMARDIEKATDMLLRRKMLHLVRVGELESWASGLVLSGSEERLTQARNLCKQLVELHDIYGIRETVTMMDEDPPRQIDLDYIKRHVEKIEQLTARLNQDKQRLLEGLKEAKSRLAQLELFGTEALLRTARSQHTFLEVLLLRTEPPQLLILEKSLASIPHACLSLHAASEPNLLLLIALKKDATTATRALATSGAIKLPLPQPVSGEPQATKEYLRQDISRRKEALLALERKMKKMTTRLSPILRRLYAQACAGAVAAEALGFFQMTSRTYIITGWLPRKHCEELVHSLKLLLGGHCYIHQERPENVHAVREKKEKVPVLLQNPNWLKHFELIVSNYDLPEYGALDPTIFVALTYPLMFGFMFGDVGHGLLLATVGMLLWHRTQGIWQSAGQLVFYCGLSSIAFGALYGSFFGREDLMPAIWMRPLDNISALLPVAIGFGVLLLSLGIALNIIQSFRSGDLSKGIFGLSGVIGGLLYWTGIYLLVRFPVFGMSPNNVTMWWLIVGGLVLILFLKAPLLHMATRSANTFPQGLMTYLIETTVELLEIVTAYVANTLSYIRLGAFALAHAGLFLAVFSLADQVRHSVGGDVWASMIIVTGNVLIFFLEGLVAAIQGLRLEYYEFFAKFFSGGGKRYRPLGVSTTV